jgi:hypothetical protein
MSEPLATSGRSVAGTSRSKPDIERGNRPLPSPLVITSRSSQALHPRSILSRPTDKDSYIGHHPLRPTITHRAYLLSSSTTHPERRTSMKMLFRPNALAAICFIVLVQGCATTASQFPFTPSCVRHDPAVFFTSPEILAELAHVYDTCYTHPACPSPTQLETIQLDGYTNSSQWLWTGPSTTLFHVPLQNAIIDKAILLASPVTPPGKVIIHIAFFSDTIVGPQPDYYVIYCKVTFATCVAPQKGMTWTHTLSNAQTGTITVGCGSTGPTPCDPIHGDTLCTQPRPLLCIYKPTPAFPLPTDVNNSDQHNQWSGGVVATTQPVAGNTFLHLSATPGTDANSFCRAQFGPDWRVAEFHDGWGWNFQAYGGTVSAPAVPSTRFWVHINDQALANCWATP